MALAHASWRAVWEASRPADSEATPEDLFEGKFLKQPTLLDWTAAAFTWAAFGSTADCAGAYGKNALWPLRKARIHRHVQRGRLAASVARDLSGGYGRRIVDGKAVLVVWGAAATRGGAEALRRRVARWRFLATQDEYSYSQICADCHCQLVLVYAADLSPDDRWQVINVAQCAAQALGEADGGKRKVVVRRRRASKGRRGCDGCGGWSPRDVTRRGRAEERDAGEARERWPEILVSGKRSGGYDVLACLSVKKCVNRPLWSAVTQPRQERGAQHRAGGG